jgi:hypothetical protein
MEHTADHTAGSAMIADAAEGEDMMTRVLGYVTIVEAL